MTTSQTMTKFRTHVPAGHQDDFWGVPESIQGQLSSVCVFNDAIHEQHGHILNSVGRCGIQYTTYYGMVYTILHTVVWYGVVWCGVLWCAVVCCGVVWYGMVWCMVWCMVWYGVWYGVWCGMVWYGMVYGVVWYGMVWYGIARHAMVLCGLAWFVWYGMVCCGMV